MYVRQRGVLHVCTVERQRTRSTYLKAVIQLQYRCVYADVSTVARVDVGLTTQIVDTRRRAELLLCGCGFATVPGLTTVGATLP